MQSLVLAGNFRELSQDEMFDVNGGWICWREVGRAGAEGFTEGALTGGIVGAIVGSAVGTIALPVVGTIGGKKKGAIIGAMGVGAINAIVSGTSNIVGQTLDAMWR